MNTAQCDRKQTKAESRAQMFCVPVGNQWLLHAPLHEVTALVNGAVIDRLRAPGQRDEDDSLRRLRRLLAAPPKHVPGPLTGDIAPAFLGIIPTRGCNIGCVYCNFGGPTAGMTHMDPAIAVAAIDWMADALARAGRRDLRIHFFGGEPFVSDEVVDIVVHRARHVAAQRGLVASFDASTNGVFNESRAEFIGDYFDSVLLSFDGFKQYHDRNRPAKNNGPTYEVVVRTAKRLRQLPVKLCLRVCITHESVRVMPDMTRWMLEEFQPAVINFETLTPGILGERAGLYPPDPYEFARGCIESYRIARQFGIRAVYSAAEFEENRISFCPVGSDTPIVTSDGRANGCYLLEEDWRAHGIDMEFGRVTAEGMQIDYNKLTQVRNLPVHKPRCDGCFCQWSCAGGCHVNHSYPGCSNEYDDFCIQTRIITACLLLSELGCDDHVDEVIGSRSMMQSIGMHPWDVMKVEGAIHD